MKEVKENLPLITVALLAIGASWIFSYYNFLGIEIINYLDFSEIFQLQFIFYFIIALPVISGVLYGLSMPGLANAPSSYSSRRKYVRVFNSLRDTFGLMAFLLVFFFFIPRNRKSKTKDNIKPFYGKPFLLAISYGICAVILSLISNKIEINTAAKLGLHDTINMLVAILYTMLFATGLYYRAKLRDSKSVNKFIDYAALIIVLIIFESLGIMYNRAEAYNIIHNKPKYEISLLLKDKPLSSDTTIVDTSKNIIYVGQTKNYIFLYNRQLEQAHIIPRSQVLDMQTMKVQYDDQGKRKAKVPIK